MRGVREPDAEAARPRFAAVSWEAGPREVTAAEIEPLVAAGVSHIVQTPFGWQRRVDSPRVTYRTEGVYWGETDEGLETTTRLAAERGIGSILKPHVWLTEADDGRWRADIAMGSEEDWRAWFASYREAILHWARLAERLGMEGFVVGTELHRAAVERPEDWRRLIRDVREVFSGHLTYAANWYREYEEIEFWDELDSIGIQGYFPLAEHPEPTVADLMRGWERHTPAIEAVRERWDKPVVFTEIGYRTAPGVAADPWTWPDRRTPGQEIDVAVQARAYEAFFRTFWDRPWVEGAFFWKWKPWPRAGLPAESLEAPSFSPQLEPTFGVLSAWYGREPEASPLADRPGPGNDG